MPAFPFSFSNLAKVSPDVVKFVRFVIDGGRINFVNELTSICEEFYYSRGFSLLAGYLYLIFIVHFFDGAEDNQVVSIFKRFGIRLEINDRILSSVNIDSKFRF